MKNKMVLKFDSFSENESFARNVIASFLLPLNPNIAELTDIKTAVSEAVTNAIVHGYPDTCRNRRRQRTYRYFGQRSGY